MFIFTTWQKEPIAICIFDIKNCFIAFSPHPAHHTRSADSTHGSAGEKAHNSASPPPNVYWTNTYFFSGRFAIKVSLWYEQKNAILDESLRWRFLLCYISSILIRLVLPECPVVSPPVITIRSFFDNPSSFDAIFFAVFKIRAYRLHKRQAL